MRKGGGSNGPWGGRVGETPISRRCVIAGAGAIAGAATDTFAAS